MNIHGDNEGMVCIEGGRLLLVTSLNVTVDLVAAIMAEDMELSALYIPLPDDIVNVGYVEGLWTIRDAPHYCAVCNKPHYLVTLSLPYILHIMRHPRSGFRVISVGTHVTTELVRQSMNRWIEEGS